MFGTEVSTTYPEAEPAIGDVGERISVGSVFDGWGYVHLFARNADNTLTELDTYAIPEAHDPAFAFGYGDLSVHEVAVDPTDPDLAYLSYYSAGLRARRGRRLHRPRRRQQLLGSRGLDPPRNR
jgi:hypothetical protein